MGYAGSIPQEDRDCKGQLNEAAMHASSIPWRRRPGQNRKGSRYK